MVKSKYAEEGNETSDYAKKIIQQQREIKQIEITSLEIEHIQFAKEEKYALLVKQQESQQATLSALNKEILNETDKNSKELEELLKKTNEIQSVQQQQIDEIEKKIAYSQANTKCLNEKLSSLQQQNDAENNSLKLLQEENASLKTAIDTKQKSLNQLKSHLADLKTEKRPIKSGLKSPGKDVTNKKVKFNDILSFKSLTESSENSTVQPVESNQVSLQVIDIVLLLCRFVLE